MLWLNCLSYHIIMTLTFLCPKDKSYEKQREGGEFCTFIELKWVNQNVATEVEYLEWGLNQRFLIQNNHMCHKNPDLLDIYAICALFTVDFRWC